MAVRDGQGARPTWARVESYLSEFAARTDELWVYALLTYVVGDLVTTFVGLQYTPLTEIGPLPAAILSEFGFGGLVVTKLLFLGLFVLLWRVAPRPASVGVPLALVIVGTGITVWNIFLIVGITLV